ncbi:MAG: PD-(D/E)XK nuclease family protein [Bdellovibrionales bacterium]|nr:PD-(D/E)XK nuclease family protein [Bdellovibrionales bacterium]
MANIRSETDILGLHRNSSTCSELKVKKEASKQVGADFGSEVKFSLSASKLERFALCPYLVASTLLFKLDDLEELDLDLDRLTNGKLTHKYFEVLLSEPLKLERTFDEHLEIIDRCREEIELSLADERFWSPLRNRFAKLGTRFLNVEREWRRQFPETRTIGREVGIRGHWSISNRCLSPKKIDDRDIFFRGFIDRIDCDSHGNLVVIDYKSSGSSYKNYSKWIEANSFQLAMYTEALEQGLVDSIGEHGEVVGACILNVKEMTREKGFVVKDRGDRLLPPKRGMLVSKDEIGKVLEGIHVKIEEIVMQMKSGRFQPVPSSDAKKKICGQCNWRSACRATHLL